MTLDAIAVRLSVTACGVLLLAEGYTVAWTHLAPFQTALALRQVRDDAVEAAAARVALHVDLPLLAVIGGLILLVFFTWLWPLRHARTPSPGDP